LRFPQGELQFDLLQNSGERERVRKAAFVLETSRTAVLLDCQPLWLDTLEAILRRIDVRVAGKATAPARALELIAEHQPDVFLTAVEMRQGEMDGITCIGHARQTAPHLRVVVVSALTGNEHIERALAAGAAAYVLKTAHPDDLATAVRQAFQPSVYFPASRGTPLGKEEGDAQPFHLTPRELEVLRLLAEGHSNAALASMLWVTPQTVKFHLSNVYRKLGVSDRTEAARWARSHGLLTPTNGHSQSDP
jgi:DNA-binding NarL/FixJ family response regulator